MSIERAAREMNTIARVLNDHFNDGAVPKQVGFVLLVMPFDALPGVRVNYVSNADRKDVIVMMKEVLARFEGQPEMKGSA